jgi:hypothetical protein
MILDSYEYMPVAYVTMHCMIWPYLKLLSLASWVQEVSELGILTVIRNKNTVNYRRSAIIFNKTLFP